MIAHSSSLRLLLPSTAYHTPCNLNVFLMFSYSHSCYSISRRMGSWTVSYSIHLLFLELQFMAAWWLSPEETYRIPNVSPSLNHSICKITHNHDFPTC